jgi:hypothetical protein
MDTKKFLMGTVVGGVAYFILGFLIYGMALADTMTAYSNPACMRPMEEMVWWALIVGNLGYASVLTYVFLKAGNVNSFGSGAQTGLMVAFLISLSVDLVMYATSSVMTSTTAIVIDVIAGSVMGAVAGGIIGVVLGMGNKPAA